MDKLMTTRLKKQHKIMKKRCIDSINQAYGILDRGYKNYTMDFSSFNFGLTEEEINRAVCNHRTPDGSRDTLVYDPNTETCRCTICNYKFKPVDQDMSVEEIQRITNNVVNIMQYMKILFPDIKESSNDFFTSIKFIQKTPRLFDIAARRFRKQEIAIYNRNMAMFNNLAKLFNSAQHAAQ